MIRTLHTALARIGARRKRRITRQFMRGHRRLRDTGRLELIEEIKSDLSLCEMRSLPERTQKILFGSHVPDPSLSIRQYMMIRLGSFSLNRAILRHLSGQAGKLAYPMPSIWRRTLENHGIQVAHTRSALMWLGYSLTLWGYGTLSNTRLALHSLLQAPRHSPAPPHQMAFFEQISANNLPRKDPDEPSYDILSWYAQWEGRLPDCQGMAHTVPSTPQTGPVPGFHSLTVGSAHELTVSGADRLGFALWGLRASLSSLLNLLFGRAIPALLLFEAGKRHAIASQPESALFGAYLFHNSGWIYRPLWSYEAEARGAEVLFYFYSTNCEDFKTTEGYQRQSNQWNLSNWPNVLAWSPRQADFMRTHNPDAVIRETGPIWFSGHGHFEPPECQQKDGQRAPLLAIFDVQPVRDSLYQSLGVRPDVYVPEFCNAFIEDLAQICAELEVTGVLKRKRDVGGHLHPKYKNLVAKLSEAGPLQQIPPVVAAQSVIDVADLVVSMPYTSTALLARNQSKPACFYDALGLLQADDRAAHGIPIVQGREALHKWVRIHLER